MQQTGGNDNRLPAGPEQPKRMNGNRKNDLALLMTFNRNKHFVDSVQGLLPETRQEVRREVQQEFGKG